MPRDWQPHPDGISQKYSIRTNYSFLNGQRVHTISLIMPDKDDILKNRNAIVPNIIDSLDSYHKMSIVEALQNDMILTIDDCFIRHPCLVKEEEIRQEKILKRT